MLRPASLNVPTFLFILLICRPAAAEKIQLKSGQVITAPIVERKDDHIKVDVSGVTVTYYQDDILNISSENPSVEKTPSPDSETKAPALDIAELREKVSQSVVVLEAIKDKSLSEGTGFFVSPDGLIATNLHVVFKANVIKVITKSGKTYPVQYIANYDDDRDICLVKIEITNAPVLPLGDSDGLKAGQTIFTIGHGGGARYQFSSGPYVGKKIIDGEETVQSKIPSVQGNSGGPILDEEGKLIGISTLYTDDGYNLSIPVNAARKFFNYNALITISDLNQQVSGAYELTFAGNGVFLEGKFEPALENFQKALSLDPNYLKARIGAAKTYTAMNRENEAFAAWQEVNKRDPENAQAHLRLGEIYLNRNLPDEAIGHLQKAIDLTPQDSGAYADLGFAYGQKNLSAEAIAAFNKAVELDPTNASAYYNLAVAYFNNRDFAAAKNFCEKARQLGYSVPESFGEQLNQAQVFQGVFEMN